MIIYSQPVKHKYIYIHVSRTENIQIMFRGGGDLSLIELCPLYLIMLVKSKYNLIQGGGGVPKSSQPDQEAINKIDK